MRRLQITAVTHMAQCRPRRNSDAVSDGEKNETISDTLIKDKCLPFPITLLNVVRLRAVVYCRQSSSGACNAVICDIVSDE